MYTYKQAYDKIIQAYFRDEIKPMDARFCFCGTLNDNIGEWGEYNLSGNDGDGIHYSYNEMVTMENALFKGIRQDRVITVFEAMKLIDSEDALFSGMCAALDVLKEIHRSRGEDVDEELTPFTKRELVK